MLLRFIKLCILCCLFSNTNAQSLLEQPITIELENVLLEEALQQISASSDVTFSYSTDQISFQKSVTISVHKVALKTVLDHLFVDTDIIYKEIGKQITLRKKASASISNITLAQEYRMVQPKLTQVVRGVVVDQDARLPLVGANVWIEGGGGVSTDINGEFTIKNVPIGRQNIRASYLGYEAYLLSKTLIISGKELVLEIRLRESVLELAEIEIEAVTDKTRPLNEFALTSARSFSVEETSRYAASILDPARMVRNFAGVSSGAGDDLSNQISVRGNSPRSNVWRLEGIDIPNPNHYSNLGGSGGGISMLNSNTLTYSDFYTGGFPAGFGNALGGVFDINLRKGNDEEKEYSFMVGSIGIEASAEGPLDFQKGASYLVNYRYSTLALLDAFGINPIPDEDAPRFQDVSFKLFLPTKKLGSFSLFGIGGVSIGLLTPVKDTSIWVDFDDARGYYERQLQGSLGLSHRLLLSDNSYLHSALVVSSLRYTEKDYYLDLDYNENNIELDTATNRITTLTTNYLTKVDAKNTLRFGFSYSHRQMKIYLENFLIPSEPELRKGYANNKGLTDLLQVYGQWKHRVNDQLVFNTGVHGSYFQFNGNYSIEPRFAMEYTASAKQSVSASVGRYSKLPHESFFFFEGVDLDGDSIVPNRDLDMTKSIHCILGYDYRFNENFRLKLEAYYQYLYNVPTATEINGAVSSVNGEDVWDIIDDVKYVNKGKGRNYGIDMTLEKFFSKQSYFLLTGSLFKSKVTLIDGLEYNTQFSTDYRINLVAGKEFKIGKKKNDIFAVNIHFVVGGGRRYTPIDLAGSIARGRQFRDINQLLGAKHAPYRRFDIGLNYKMNRKKITHTFSLDLQNATNQENVYQDYYEPLSQTIKFRTQAFIIPFVNYRIDF